MNGQLIKGKAMKTGNASYKKNEKKQNNANNNNTNFQQDLNAALQTDPNLLLQQQQYLAQFYLANGYQPNMNMNPLLYQLYAQLLMNQNMQQNINQNIGNIPNMGNDNMNLQQQLQGLQGQDLSQILGNIAFLQMGGIPGMGGDMNSMMGTNNENNPDSQ